MRFVTIKPPKTLTKETNAADAANTYRKTKLDMETSLQLTDYFDRI